VQYAIEADTLHVRAANGSERMLRIVSRTSKYSAEYSALGNGHYIKTVAPDGARVTLEDGSRWDMDPRLHFSIAAWEPDDLITERRSTDDPSFPFSVDNTSRDDGAAAKHLSR
jgi:hypothetical protein